MNSLLYVADAGLEVGVNLQVREPKNHITSSSQKAVLPHIPRCDLRTVMPIDAIALDNNAMLREQKVHKELAEKGNLLAVRDIR